MERTTHKDKFITHKYNHTVNVLLSETLRYVTVQQNSRTTA